MLIMNKHVKFYSGHSFIPQKPLKHALWISGALLMLSSTAFANTNLDNAPEPTAFYNKAALQQKEIRGVVRGADSGEPLAGVTVRVVGKSVATSTDENGVFTIQAAVNDVIEINYIGYQASRITVLSSTSQVNIDLQVDNSNLEEVVVTGYGAQRRKDLTGAVAVVDVAELKAQPAASAVEALQGKATGVQI